jgi:hypothetical protein
MHRGNRVSDRRCAVGVLAALLCSTLQAQQAAAPRPVAPTPTARAQAPIDATGYWVSAVTQNWQFRMVLPGRGEYVDIPINEKAMAVADAWDPKQEEAAGRQCQGNAAPLLMRLPGRLHIGWQDDETLKVDADNGEQTRLLRFKPTPAEQSAPATWQGLSRAHWMLHAGAAADAPSFGTLNVATEHLLPGLLRKNGVPYSANARMTEYWELHKDEAGVTWMTITTEFDDPEFLRGPLSYTSIFMKEPDGAKWDPRPCTLRL